MSIWCKQHLRQPLKNMNKWVETHEERICCHTGHEKSLHGSINMTIKLIICYDLYDHQISAQMNTYGRRIRQCSLSQLPKYQISWKNAVHPSSRIYDRFVESMSIEAVLVAQHLSKDWYMLETTCILVYARHTKKFVRHIIWACL